MPTPPPPENYLDDETVREIRDTHEVLREQRGRKPENQRETNSTLDAQVAEVFGISRAYVGRLVDGSARPKAPGPLDLERAKAAQLYTTEVQSYGVAGARERRRLRNRGITPPTPPEMAKAQRVEILDARGRPQVSHILEPGQALRVSLVDVEPT